MIRHQTTFPVDGMPGDYAYVGKVAIQRIEHGQSAPSLDVVVSLADALGLPLPELLTLGNSTPA